VAAPAERSQTVARGGGRGDGERFAFAPLRHHASGQRVDSGPVGRQRAQSLPQGLVAVAAC
jgi:hypothetical protein